MSKVAKLINAKLSRDALSYRDIRCQYVSVDSEISPLEYSQDIVKCKIGVNIETTVTVSNDGQIIKEALVTAKRAVLEEIFGEFRQLIADIEHANYDIDRQTVGKLIKTLRHEMFHAGVYE